MYEDGVRAFGPVEQDPKRKRLRKPRRRIGIFRLVTLLGVAGFVFWGVIHYITEWVRHFEATKSWSGIITAHPVVSGRYGKYCGGSDVSYAYQGVAHTGSVTSGCGQVIGTRLPIMIDPGNPSVITRVGSSDLIWDVLGPVLGVIGIVAIAVIITLFQQRLANRRGAKLLSDDSQETSRRGRRLSGGDQGARAPKVSHIRWGNMHMHAGKMIAGLGLVALIGTTAACGSSAGPAPVSSIPPQLGATGRPPVGACWDPLVQQEAGRSLSISPLSCSQPHDLVTVATPSASTTQMARIDSDETLHKSAALATYTAGLCKPYTDKVTARLALRNVHVAGVQNPERVLDLVPAPFLPTGAQVSQGATWINCALGTGPTLNSSQSAQGTTTMSGTWSLADITAAKPPLSLSLCLSPAYGSIIGMQEDCSDPSAYRALASFTLPQVMRIPNGDAALKRWMPQMLHLCQKVAAQSDPGVNPADVEWFGSNYADSNSLSDGLMTCGVGISGPVTAGKQGPAGNHSVPGTSPFYGRIGS